MSGACSSIEYEGYLRSQKLENIPGFCSTLEHGTPSLHSQACEDVYIMFLTYGNQNQTRLHWIAHDTASTTLNTQSGCACFFVCDLVLL